MTSKKTVLITGCSDGGIGSGIALTFHQRGYHVFATARDTSKMFALKDLPRMTLLILDVEDPTHIFNAVETVESKTGGTLDILINNAGRNHFMPVLDINIDEAKRIFDTNFWGALAVTQAFTPLVIKAEGTIVNIGSISGHVNVPHMGLYAASKRSVEIISETLRLELGPFGVTVLCVVNGAVHSNGQTYFQDWKLPENSLYKSIEEIIGNRARGGDGVKRSPLMDHANEVVGKIIGGASGKAWCGSRARSTRFGVGWLPQSIMDSGVAQGTGLDVLRKNLKDSRSL